MKYIMAQKTARVLFEVSGSSDGVGSEATVARAVGEMVGTGSFEGDWAGLVVSCCPFVVLPVISDGDSAHWGKRKISHPFLGGQLGFSQLGF